MTRAPLRVSLPPDPNTRAPHFVVPPGACDTHAHVFGPPDLFPYADDRRYTPPAAPVEHYRNMQKITGLSRAVFVTPTAHGTDNRVVLNAISVLGDAARGIANIDKSFYGCRHRRPARGRHARRALPSDGRPPRQRGVSHARTCRACSGAAGFSTCISIPRISSSMRPTSARSPSRPSSTTWRACAARTAWISLRSSCFCAC